MEELTLEEKKLLEKILGPIADQQDFGEFGFEYIDKILETENIQNILYKLKIREKPDNSKSPKEEGIGKWWMTEDGEYWVELNDGSFGVWDRHDDIYKVEHKRIENKEDEVV